MADLSIEVEHPDTGETHALPSFFRRAPLPAGDEPHDLVDCWAVVYSRVPAEDYALGCRHYRQAEDICRSFGGPNTLRSIFCAMMRKHTVAPMERAFLNCLAEAAVRGGTPALMSDALVDLVVAQDPHFDRDGIRAGEDFATLNIQMAGGLSNGRTYTGSIARTLRDIVDGSGLTDSYRVGYVAAITQAAYQGAAFD